MMGILNQVQDDVGGVQDDFPSGQDDVGGVQDDVPYSSCRTRFGIQKDAIGVTPRHSKRHAGLDPACSSSSCRT
ncbi:MAG: hypothetical protein QHI38_08195 [Armatimonadota bacterium]|nr:hypothetical protein [Armatimonadota bacterium]